MNESCIGGIAVEIGGGERGPVCKIATVSTGQQRSQQYSHS